MKHYSVEEILKNNQAWAAQKVAQDRTYFEDLVTGQKPPYLYIGCSDSRLALTKFTGTEPGELFVHRNIANQVSLTDINFLAILEYAVIHLEVKHIIVAGHYSCGGIKAALEGRAIGLVDNWVNPIREIYLQKQDEIDALPTQEERWNRLAEMNVVMQVKNLYQTSVMRQVLEQQKPPEVHGWIVDIRTGLIKDLQLSTKQWELRSLFLAVL
jgi:carbonic anhydrase